MMIDASPKRETTRRPIFFESREGTLFGVFTSPSEPTRVANKAVVLLQGGGIPSSGVNRDAVRLADRLASMGYASFRFDFHGMGDSVMWRIITSQGPTVPIKAERDSQILTFLPAPIKEETKTWMRKSLRQMLSE